MGILVGIAVILLAALGVVTIMQRRMEFSRRLDAARRKQRTLAETLMRLQRESDFADSYQAGEANELAQNARSQTARLSSQFAEASRHLDGFKGLASLFPSMDSYVGIARVLEDYEAVEQGITQLQDGLKRLDTLLQSAKEQSGGLAKEWSDVKGRIVQLMGADLPTSWQQEFQRLDADLTRLSVATDPVRRAAELQKIELQVQHWKQDVDKFAVWSEWKNQAANRRPLMEATVARLEKIGAKETQACIELKAVLDNLTHLQSLTADEIRLPANARFLDLLGPSFTGLLNRASVLLSLMADRNRLQDAVGRQRSQLQNLYSRWSEVDYQNREKIVQEADAGWFSGYQRRKQELAERIQPVFEDHGVESTPLTTLLLVDQLLFLGEQTTNLQMELESRYSHVQQLDATYEARLKVLAGRISDGLAQLAGANLMGSEEYLKLSRWQEEVHRLETMEVPALEDVKRLEERVKEEWKVIEAAVKSRSSIDAGLQDHLDRLVRRHQDSPIPGAYGDLVYRRHAHDNTVAMSPGVFNTEGLAWTSLILAEEALASSSWTADDNWF